MIHPIYVPLIGEHFNHFVQSVEIFYGASQKIILPKKSTAFIRAVGVGTINVFSDTDNEGQNTGTALFEPSEMYAELDECSIVFIKLESTVAPTNTIKKLIKYLVDTNGGKVDEALAYVSDRRILNTNRLALTIRDDLNNSTSYTEFLEDKCGIILGNEDTGAITGSDAGGSVTKNRKQVPQ